MDDDPRLSHYVYIYMANRDKPLKFAFNVGETIEYLCIKVRTIFFFSVEQGRIETLIVYPYGKNERFRFDDFHIVPMHFYPSM